MHDTQIMYDRRGNFCSQHKLSLNIEVSLIKEIFEENKIMKQIHQNTCNNFASKILKLKV